MKLTNRIILTLTFLACNLCLLAGEPLASSPILAEDSVHNLTITFPVMSNKPKEEYTQERFLRINKLLLIHWADSKPHGYVISWPSQIAVRFERKDSNVIRLIPLGEGFTYSVMPYNGDEL